MAETYYAVVDHHAPQALAQYTVDVIRKGRVRVVRLRDGVAPTELPGVVRRHLQPIDPGVLSTTPLSRERFERRVGTGQVAPDPVVVELLEQVTEGAVSERIQEIVALGPRSSAESRLWFQAKLADYGYQPLDGYNVEAWKHGTVDPDRFVIVLGHMDTVSNTVGADDNASGAAGVLEAARVLAPYQSERSILFLVTEDEEKGLLGARAFVEAASEAGILGNIDFVVNMDMIAYNENGVIDLETKPQFEAVTDWMAEQAMLYTSLSPNKVLFAWGSDHVPFIDAGVPTLLTIEHWSTHTPCWHRACDTMETLNIPYATEVIRLNVAAIALKAGVELGAPSAQTSRAPGAH